jgi:hypothetical protein
MDIGSLTGQIAIEDQMSDVLTMATSKVEGFVKSFSGAFGAAGVAAVAATAAVAGTAAAIAALGNRGADVNDLSENITKFSGSAEKTTEIMQAMSKGTLGTVDNFTLMKDASKLMSAGAVNNASDFGTLTSAAFTLQNRGLGSTTEMMDMLSGAMTTGRTKALQQAGVYVDLEKGQQDYAKSLNLTSDKLSDSEKRTANQITIMAGLNKMVAEAGAQQRDFGEQIEAAGAWVTNMTDKLAGQVASSPAVTQAMSDIGDVLSDVFGGNSEGMINTIMAAIEGFAKAVSATITYARELAGVFSSELSGSGSQVTDIFNSIWTVVQVVWGLFVKLFDIVLLLMKPLGIVASSVLPVLALAFRTLADTVQIVSNVLGWLLDKVSAVIGWMQNNTPVLGWLSSAFKGLSSAVNDTNKNLTDQKPAAEGAAAAHREAIDTTAQLTEGTGFL